MVQRIALAGRLGADRFALVDDEDAPLVAAYIWHLARNPGSNEYARGWVGGRRVMMHCLILGLRGIDHINNDGLDNQRHNLRPATHSQNIAHAVKMSRNRQGRAPSSRYKGVSWRKPKPPRRGFWVAHAGRSYLGTFSSEEAAARAYDAAAREAYGEFAVLNFQP